MNRKCIRVVKTNNYKGLCIRHTFVKRELFFLNIYRYFLFFTYYFKNQTAIAHHPVFTILSFLLSVRKFYGFHQCILLHTCRTVIAIRLNFLQQCIQIHQGSALDFHALVTVQLQPYAAGVGIVYPFVICREL